MKTLPLSGYSIIAAILMLLLSGNAVYAQLPITFKRELNTTGLYKGVGVPETFRSQDAFRTAFENIAKGNSADTPKFNIRIKGRNEADIKLYGDISETAKVVAHRLDSTYNAEYDANMRKLVENTTNLDDLHREISKLDELRELQKDTVAQWKNFSKEFDYRRKVASVVSFWFIHNDVDAQLFHKTVASDKTAGFLQNTMLSFGSDGEKASLYSELYSDYYGPLRAGFGALVSNKETKVYTDSTGRELTDSNSIQQDAVQRLLGGGGNATFTLSYPLLNIHSNNNRFSTRMFLSGRVGADLPGIGTESSDVAWNADPAVETYVYFIGGNNTITPYLNARFSYVMGDKKFFKNLQLDDAWGFAYHTLNIGLAFKSTLRISYNMAFGDKFVEDNFSNVVAVSIIP